MLKLDFKTQVLPHIIAALVFVLITATYFSDAVFQGKTLKQGDAVNWAGSSREISLHRENNNGEEPLWTNGMFGGMPAYTISTLYKGELLEYVDNYMRIGLPYPTSIIFIGMLCYYIMLLVFGVDTALAVIGAIAFTLCSNTLVSIEAGHNSKMRAVTFAPLFIAGMTLLFRQKWVWGFALSALGIGLQIRAGHYQITYYLGFIAGIYFIAEAIYAVRKNYIKPFAIAAVLLLAASGLGVATNAGRLMVLQEYTQYSMRGKPELQPKPTELNKPRNGGLDKDYVFSWSNGPAETFTLLVPYLYGGSSNEKPSKKTESYQVLSNAGIDVNGVQLPYYWGKQPFTSGPVYAGAIVIFLFVLGCFIADVRYRWWLLGATVLSCCLAMGSNFKVLNYAMYDYFPAYNKFRTVTMSIFIAQLAMPLLGILGLKAWFYGGLTTKQKTNALYIALGITGGLAAIFFMVPSVTGDFTAVSDSNLGIQDPGFKAQLVSALEADRESMLRSDALRSLIFIILAGAALWASLRGYINLIVTACVLAGLVLFDLWAVDKRYVNKENFEKAFWSNQFIPTAADNKILTDKNSTYRVLNLNSPFTDSHTSYHHQSIGGYSPVKIRRYQDLIENDLTSEIQTTIGQLQNGSFTEASLKGDKVLNMLNTRYLKASEEAAGVIVNPYAMGNCWFVTGVQAVSSPDAELDAIKMLNADSMAVVDTKKFNLAKLAYNKAGATIRQVSWKSNHIEYESNNPAEGLAIFSEIYYPEGWVATIDGSPANIIRANYVLRGLVTPAGKHKIDFRFAPKSYDTGNLIGLISSVSIILLLVGAVGYSFVDSGQKKN